MIVISFLTFMRVFLLDLFKDIIKSFFVSFKSIEFITINVRISMTIFINLLHMSFSFSIYLTWHILWDISLIAYNIPLLLLSFSTIFSTDLIFKAFIHRILKEKSLFHLRAIVIKAVILFIWGQLRVLRLILIIIFF